MTIIRRSESVIGDRVGDQLSLLDLRTAEFFSANIVGAEIWEVCEGATVQNCITAVQSKFPNVDAALVSDSVRVFLDQLSSNGLILYIDG